MKRVLLLLLALWLLAACEAKHFITDCDGRLLSRLATDLHLPDAGHLPLVLLLNARGQVIFLSRGYRVGLGTQIINIMNKK